MGEVFGTKTRAGRRADEVTKGHLAVRAFLRFFGGPGKAHLPEVLAVMREQLGVVSAKNYPIFQEAKAWIEIEQPDLAARLYSALDSLAKGEAKSNSTVDVSETKKPFITAYVAATGAQRVSTLRQIAAFQQRRYGSEDARRRGELNLEMASMQFLIDHFGAEDYDWNNVEADQFVIDFKADPLVPERAKERVVGQLKSFVDACGTARSEGT